MTWHRAVDGLVSVSNCVIYILQLLLSYKYDDVVVSCRYKQQLPNCVVGQIQIQIIYKYNYLFI